MKYRTIYTAQKKLKSLTLTCFPFVALFSPAGFSISICGKGRIFSVF